MRARRTLSHGGGQASRNELPNSGRARGETGIGYRIPQKSLLNTFNADSLFESYTFTFRRQFINRAPGLVARQLVQPNDAVDQERNPPRFIHRTLRSQLE